MATGFPGNALDAMELIGPSATGCLNHAGAVTMRGLRFLLAESDQADLLADVPTEHMHAPKKLGRVDRNHDSLTLHFTDGTTFCYVQPEQPAMYLWEHPPARTYVSGPVCATGKAAHTTTPWQGSGGCMSMEGNLVLSTLLGHAKTAFAAQIDPKVYDPVRRPRTQRIVKSSQDMGLTVSGLNEQLVLSSEKLRAELLSK
ncbi:hypothetical protein PISL3812_04041 [Talaromyces islandicus]|uniref:FAD-binding domain-containing protein n=1 Tax=Talaromyces islandicus TaxID=28573 RepID=A0A0U1LUF1_TALIS|nr:hypothetical protein PISL3812_04041 [Talaromyces islandicus]